jgi:hypothetical protein
MRSHDRIDAMITLVQDARVILNRAHADEVALLAHTACHEGLLAAPEAWCAAHATVAHKAHTTCLAGEEMGVR